MSEPAPTLPKGPFILFGLMTVFSLVGPFAIFLVIRGGRNPDWPPDRPVEWLTFGVVTGAVVVLMLACVMSGRLWRPR